MFDHQEHPALLAIVARSHLRWHETASLIELAGSARRLLDGTWPTTLEPDEAEGVRRIAGAVTEDDVGEYAELLRGVEGAELRLVTVLDSEYPVNLRQIYNRPPFLFVRGRLSEADRRAVSVVGSRKASDEGLRQARVLCQQLVANGITVLSGLALGIDSAAHEATLDAGGRTIAVMGTGIRRIYPAANQGLAQRIIASGGAWVSQFWPDAPPTRVSFPMRNVVNSGMGIGTVVVEAHGQSGAKMQARLCLEHGKRLFLLESLVLHEDWARKMAQRAGATVVKGVDDVLEVLKAELEAPAQLSLY